MVWRMWSGNLHELILIRRERICNLDRCLSSRRTVGRWTVHTSDAVSILWKYRWQRDEESIAAKIECNLSSTKSNQRSRGKRLSREINHSFIVIYWFPFFLLSSRHRPKRNRISFYYISRLHFRHVSWQTFPPLERKKKLGSFEINSLSHSISIVLTSLAETKREREHYSSSLHSLNKIQSIRTSRQSGDYEIRQKIELHSACVSDPIFGSSKRKNSVAKCDCIMESSSSPPFDGFAHNSKSSA